MLLLGGNFIINLIKGFFIGIALVIPGLSASTFAVVTGLYSDIINSVNNIFKNFKKSTLFLIPIAIGAAIGVLVSASGTLHIMELFPMLSYSFFIGLVLGSLPNIYKRAKPKISNHLNYLLIIFGLILIILMGTMNENDGSVVAIENISGFEDFFVIFFAGVISLFLMAIPGTSGSITLMVLGQFGTIYSAVSNFRILIIFVFGIGALTGGAIAAKIVGFFIERYEANIYFLVFGLVLGSVYILYDTGLYGNIYGIFDILYSIIFIIFGIICTRIIGRGDRD